MQKELVEIYNDLVPTDQTVIEIMLLTLRKKDKQIKNLLKEVKKHLDKDME